MGVTSVRDEEGRSRQGLGLLEMGATKLAARGHREDDK